MPRYIEHYLPPVMEDGLATRKAVDFSNASSVALPAGTTIGGIALGSTDTLTGAGAVSLTTLITRIVTTGANALTLADGTVGQQKTLVMVTDGGDATLTPATKTGFSTITLNDVGDTVNLLFTATTGWVVTGSNGVVIA